jgi:hypothetical protein
MYGLAASASKSTLAKLEAVVKLEVFVATLHAAVPFIDELFRSKLPGTKFVREVSACAFMHTAQLTEICGQ